MENRNEKHHHQNTDCYREGLSREIRGYYGKSGESNKTSDYDTIPLVPS